MLSISSQLKAWKAVEDQEDPMVMLVEIDVSDSETVYLVNGDPAGKGGLTYDGNAYIPRPMRRDDVKENVEGSLFSHTLSITNVDGVAGGYIELNELEGRTVTITYIPLSLVGNPQAGDAIVETWKIQDQQYSRETATLSLGNPNLLDRIVPYRKYLRHRCQWNYARRFEDGPEGCFYPSDFFEDDTEQDFKTIALTDAETEAKHGWFVRHATNASKIDVNITDSGMLYFQYPDITVVHAYKDTDNSGPFLYKFIDGDFDVWTKVDGSFVDDGSMCGILISSSAPDDSIGFWRAASAPRIIARETLNGVSNADESKSTSDLYLRATRVGVNVFNFYHSSDGITWTHFHEDLQTMPTTLRVGAAIQQDVAGPSAESFWVWFKFFRFFSGGKPNCTRLLDGTDGCKEHKNTSHFFGFSVPRRG